MRISLLEKREDFYNIFSQTLKHSSFFKESKIENEKTYFVNIFLNFIATSCLPKSVFQIIINEYSQSLNWWRKGIQYLYVNIATSKNFRAILSHKTILLPDYFSNYLFLGGNHRLRLLTIDLNSCIVILKNGERIDYIRNDILIRTENTIKYAPKLIQFGEDWLEEEYFEGTPVNRLTNTRNSTNYLNRIHENHFQTLNLHTKKNISKYNYIQLVEKEIFSIVKNKKIKIEKNLLNLIEEVICKLFDIIVDDNILISWTHGDFQKANILISDRNYKVIDWEASAKRYYLYDTFVLFGGIREGTPLVDALQVFKNSSNLINLVSEANNNTFTLLIIEELRFIINETFSENFYNSGLKTTKLCETILTYINER